MDKSCDQAASHWMLMAMENLIIEFIDWKIFIKNNVSGTHTIYTSQAFGLESLLLLNGVIKKYLIIFENFNIPFYSIFKWL